METKKIFLSLFTVSAFRLLGVSGVNAEVSVMEGDSVTLHTGVKTNQQENIKWYFNNTHIAQINGDLSYNCTDVQCNKSNERFRDRLELDHQTGSLTITNIRNTDSGEYTLMIMKGSESEKIFKVSVHGVSGVDTGEVSVMEGDSVTLHTGVEMNQQENIKWYFNNTLIAEITGNQSKICTDDRCDEKFRDILKLDHQTGSLTITNTKNTDSGEYKLKIISSRFSIIRSFSVSVTDSGPATVVLTGICVAVLVLMIFSVMAAVNYYRRRSSRRALVWVLKALYIQKQEPPQSQASADSPGQDGEY